jgi:hypothetical protein
MDSHSGKNRCNETKETNNQKLSSIGQVVPYSDSSLLVEGGITNVGQIKSIPTKETHLQVRLQLQETARNW